MEEPLTVVRVFEVPGIDCTTSDFVRVRAVELFLADDVALRLAAADE